MTDVYGNFQDLKAKETEGQDYRIRGGQGNQPVLIIAPHGGKIEPYTSEIAQWIAGDDFAWYAFEGIKEDNNRSLHITSHHFDEPLALMFLAEADLVLSIHGHRNSLEEFIMVGGLDVGLGSLLTEALTQAGFVIEEGGTGYRGVRSTNICNRGRRGKGAQLEISFALRKQLQDNEVDRRRFIEAVRSALTKAREF